MKSAIAQSWPTKPVKLIVPFTPGGSQDVIGRLFAQKLGEALGQQVVVENKAGARGQIATQEVARSTPDGYMLLLSTGAQMAIEPSLRPNVGYAPLKDFVHIVHLADAPSGVSREDGRISDSQVGNLVADMMREATGADVAMINGGDVRDALPSGDVRYVHLFQVLPKNLSLVTVEVPFEKLVDQIMLSVKSCGRRGALQISGMTLVFRRDCAKAVDGEDLEVEIAQGTRVKIVRGMIADVRSRANPAADAKA